MSLISEQNVMMDELSGLSGPGSAETVPRPKPKVPPYPDTFYGFIQNIVNELRFGKQRVIPIPFTIPPEQRVTPPPMNEYQRDHMAGLGELADLGAGGEKAQQIIDAISSGLKNVTRAAKGEPVDSEVPLSKVLLILGGGYLLYKIIDRTKD